MTPKGLQRAQAARSAFEERLRELQPYRPETKADPVKAAEVGELQRRLGDVNDAIRRHYVEEAEATKAAAESPADGLLF